MMGDKYASIDDRTEDLKHSKKLGSVPSSKRESINKTQTFNNSKDNNFDK